MASGFPFADVLGAALAEGHHAALAVSVLAHPASCDLSPPALRAIGRIAYAIPGQRFSERDVKLVENCAQAILAYEIAA